MGESYDIALRDPFGWVCRIYGIYYWKHERGMSGFALTEYGALKKLQSIENSKSVYRTKGGLKLVSE